MADEKRTESQLQRVENMVWDNLDPSENDRDEDESEEDDSDQCGSSSSGV
jgi:hypothetical protein